MTNNIHTFSWKDEMQKAEKKLARKIIIMEKIGKGNKAAEAKANLLTLKKRISETYG